MPLSFLQLSAETVDYSGGTEGYQGIERTHEFTGRRTCQTGYFSDHVPVKRVMFRQNTLPGFAQIQSLIPAALGGWFPDGESFLLKKRNGL